MQTADIVGGTCDARLFQLIETGRRTIEELRANGSKFAEGEMADLIRMAIEATEVGFPDGTEATAKLKQTIHDMEKALFCLDDSCVIMLTFGRKILSIIKQKYSSILEYLLTKECYLSNAIQPSNEANSTGSGSSSNSSAHNDDRDSKHFAQAWHGFLMMFYAHTNTEESNTPPAASTMATVTIQDFSIVKPISKGAYGKVYLARKKNTGDLVAIKVLTKADIINKNQQDTIITERNALATANHPFIVRLYYAFQSKKYVYLVMEYLIGGDLASLLQNLSFFEESMVKSYMSELVLVLEYLHSIGIVHRDLKPDNILINYDGHIKLTDFGLSKIGVFHYEMNSMSSIKLGDNPLRNLSHENKNESDGRIMGTPDYLSPEILLGQRAGFGADWWAVGVITFELLTGCPPFNDETPEAIFDNILRREMFGWPEELDISPSCQSFVEALSQPAPKTRLGANGTDEIKKHAFFEGIVWTSVFSNSMDDIFVPNISSPDDTSYFMSRGMSMSVSVTELDSPFSSGVYDRRNSTNSPNVFQNFNLTNIQALREKKQKRVEQHRTKRFRR